MTQYRDIALSEFKRLGIKDGELYIRNAKSIHLEYRNKDIEKLKEENEKAAAIRIINNKRLGFSYTSSLSPEALKKTIQDAYEFSKFTSENPYYRILSEDLAPRDVDVYDPMIPEVSIDALVSYAERMEDAARAFDKRIKDFRMIGVKKGYGEILLSNTYGIERSYSYTFIYFLVELIAEEGEEREMGFEMALSPFLSRMNPEEVGENAARKAVSKLGGKIYKTGKFPVVFDPEAEAEVLGALFPAFSGENVMKGKSLYKDMLGEKIAEEHVSLVNDGTLKDGVSSSPFDDEGVPTKRVEIISSGELTTYLHNLYSATFFNTKSTGSGFRSTLKSPPSISPANLHLLPGRKTPRDLISDIKEGIYVTSIIGAHTINPVSGDFSVGITGQLIENGEITYPLRGMTLAGNIRDFFKGIRVICNDLRFFPNGIGGSTILVEGLSIGGK